MKSLTLEEGIGEDLASANETETSSLGIFRKVTCLNRLIGRCTHCKEDYDIAHHPNNYDCNGYHPVNLFIFEVAE